MNRKRWIPLLALTGLCLLATACTEKDTRPELSPATTYDGTRFRSAAASELALLANLERLTDLVRAGRSGEEIGVRDLTLAYGTNSPSLKNRSTEYFVNLLQGPGNYLEKAAAASTQKYLPGPPTGGSGGTYGGYLFDANGVEPEQIVEKGLLGAALYYSALNLYTQNPNVANPATADQVLALYGASPAFPSSTNSSRHPVPDRAQAALAAQRDNNSGNGLYSQIRNHFLMLQASYAAGEQYQRERNKAFADILNTWEKSMAATVIHNSRRVQALLGGTSAASEPTRAEALHLYNASIGLLNGFRTVPSTRIQPAQLDELLTLLNFPPGGTPAPYKVLTTTATELPRLAQVVAQLKSTYGFTDQEMEDLNKNWVAEQNR
jgi:hypothetical protein